MTKFCFVASPICSLLPLVIPFSAPVALTFLVASVLLMGGVLLHAVHASKR